MPAFADRLGRVQVAASVQMTIRARELRAQGVDIVSAHHRRAELRLARATRSRRRMRRRCMAIRSTRRRTARRR